MILHAFFLKVHKEWEYGHTLKLIFSCLFCPEILNDGGLSFDFFMFMSVNTWVLMPSK